MSKPIYSSPPTLYTPSHCTHPEHHSNSFRECPCLFLKPLSSEACHLRWFNPNPHPPLLPFLGQNFPRHAGVSPFPRLPTSPHSNSPAPLITPVLKFSTFKPPGHSTTTLFLFKFDLTTRTSSAHLPSSLPAPPPTFLPTYSPFISLAKVALLTPTLPTLPPT